MGENMTNKYCPDISLDKIISEEIIEPTENNDIKTVIIIYKNNKKETVKRTVTFQVRKKMVKIKRSVLERRQWAKFGSANVETDHNLVSFGSEVELSMEPKKKD